MTRSATRIPFIALFGLAGLAQLATAEPPDRRNLMPDRSRALAARPAPADPWTGATEATFDYPSDDSTIVGSVGFIDDDEVGFFWSVGRGDSVTETFADAPSITGYSLDVDVLSNALNSGAFVNWDVIINGVTVDNFTVNEGFLGTVSRSATFPAIAGPNYTVEMRVTNEVAPGEGSHTFRYALSGFHQVELVSGGGGDPVRFLQLNEFPDCYIVNFRNPGGLTYGDIPIYPAIFTGSRADHRMSVGWTTDGGTTMLLTVFRAGFTEELYQYIPGSGFALVGTATWSYASSCDPLKASDGPHQAPR
jgi:hypothetical protein